MRFNWSAVVGGWGRCAAVGFLAGLAMLVSIGAAWGAVVPAPGATTFFVSTSGSDSNSGSSASPWKTIQHAASVMVAGQSVTVNAGTYSERVTASHSGTSSSPIAFVASGTVITKGFEITGSFVIVTGFEIGNVGNPSSDQKGYGIYLGGSNLTVTNNYIHDLCVEGFWVDGNNNLIQSNTIVRAEMAGGQVNGQNNQIFDNDVSHTQQYPSGCSSRGGADADGFRYFGSGHVFRGNYIHDIDWGTSINPDPHVDCFQTWGPASNMIVEQNRCIWGPPTENTDREFCEHESLDGTATNFTFRNNLFVNGRDGCQFESGVSGIKFYNNTVINPLHGCVAFYTTGNSVMNNIVAETADSFLRAPSGNTVSNNIQYNRSGGYGTFGSPYTSTHADPKFANFPADATSYFSGDYHLQSSSPAIDKGADLSAQGVSVDMDNTLRPQGVAFDIGAYEFLASGATPTAGATATPGTPVATPSGTFTPVPTATPTATPGLSTTTTSVSSSGGPGQTVSGGSFTVANNTAVARTIAAITITFSSPSLFSSATLSSGASTATVAPPIETTQFVLSPPVVVTPGASAAFNVSMTFSMNGAMLDRPAVRYASVAGPITDGGGPASLIVVWGVFGLCLMPLGSRRQRKVLMMLASAIVLATATAGCGGGGGTGGGVAAQSTAGSVQTISTMSVVPATSAAGLPASLGTVTLR